MLLSLCVITKDEEKNIKKCLDSVSDILFEKIVVDTGSLDKTIEIAKNEGADVYKFDWIGDFSAARNYAISKAKGDWILFLDADEYIEPDQSNLLYSLLIKAEEQKSDCIVSKLINYIPDSDSRIMQSVTSTIRIFRNSSELGYVGAIHEILKPKKNRPLTVIDASESLVVFHTGYSRTEVIRKNKVNRNLSLLYKELEKSPKDASILFYIAESLMLDDKYKEAVSYLERAKKYNSINNKVLMYKLYCNLFACKCSHEYDLTSVEDLYKKAIQYDNECPDFSFYIGKKHLILGNYEQAIEFYELCLLKLSKYQYNFESMVLSRVNHIYEELLNLYVVTENKNKIIETCIILLKVDKYNYKCLYILINTLKDHEKSEQVFNFIFEIYSKESIKDKLYLLKVLDSLAYNELYNLVIKLLSKEEEREYFLYKEHHQNSLEEYRIESQGLNALDCFRRGEFYKQKNNNIKSLYFHSLAYEMNPQVTSDVLLQDYQIPNYKNYLGIIVDTVKEYITDLISQNILNEALRIVNQSIQIVTNDVDLYSMKAVIMMKLESNGSAKEVLSEGLVINPKHIDSLYNLAYLYELENQFDLATDLYKKILELSDERELLEEVKIKIVELSHNKESLPIQNNLAIDINKRKPSTKIQINNNSINGKTTSIVLLTYNKLDLTKLCIQYLIRFTDMSRVELIVVDNGSTDGTTEWLEEQKYIDKLIIHHQNQGYTKGFNSGIKHTNLEEVFLLANDILVTPNWLENLRACLNHSEKVGLVVPVMNYASNGQAIDVEYKNLDDMVKFASQYNDHDPLKWEEKARLITCCAFGKKSNFKKVDMFDERYLNGGSFSDDDISFKFISAGYKLFLCKDTFVHHYGSQTVSEGLLDDLNRGREKFIQKWGFDSWEKSGVHYSSLSLMKNIHSNSKILVVGCGVGETLLYIKQNYPNTEIFGIESNVNAAYFAKNFGKVLEVNLLVDKIKLKEDYFDFILLTGVLNEKIELDQLLKKVSPFLKRDTGFILGKFPNRMSIRTINKIMSGYSESDKNDYSLNELKQTFINNGFVNITIDAILNNISQDEEVLIEAFNKVNKTNMSEIYRVSDFVIRANTK